MNNILEKICEDKKELVDWQRKKVPEKELQILIDNIEKPRAFKKTIDANFKDKNISIIAEIKKASPSKGIICEKFNPSEIAKKYTKGNATCLSVLTDNKYFLGCSDDLINAKKNSNIPVLRKDFIIDEYQIIESRAIGADCILLIHGAIETDIMKKFIEISHQLNMDVLIETHSLKELMFWLDNDNILLGINNRNLKNMDVDLKHSINLKQNINVEKNIICESGILSEKDIDYLIDNKFKTFLIGEFLMKSENPDLLLKKLINRKSKE